MICLYLFLLINGIYSQPDSPRSINIGLTNPIKVIDDFNRALQMHMAASTCQNSTKYGITVIPFNTTPTYVSPIGRNDVTLIQMFVGPKIYFGPSFYGFSTIPNVFKFANDQIELFDMNLTLRFQIIMTVVNDIIGNDVNKTVAFIIDASRVNLMEPWTDINLTPYLHEFKGQVRVLRYTNQLDANTIAATIKTENVLNIVVDLDWVGTNQLILACKDRDLLSWKYRWMVFFSSFAHLYSTISINLAYSQNFSVYDFSRACDPLLNDAISIRNERNLINADIAFSLVKLMDFQNCGSAINQSVEVSTGRILFNKVFPITRETWTIEVYRNVDKFKVVGRVVVDQTGRITVNQPKIPLKNFTTEAVLAQMRSQTFRIVALAESPFVRMANGSLDPLKPGYSIEMIQIIMRNLSVKYKIQVANISHGILINNKLTGILGVVQNGQADIAIGPIVNMPKYRTYIDFSETFWPFKLSIIYREAGQDLIVSMFQFLNIFNWQVWVLMIGCCIVYAGGITIVHLISPNRVDFHFLLSFLFTMGSQVQGVTTALPDRPSGRVLVVFWWIFNIVFLLAYVANYGAFRTNVRLQATIQNLDDLTKQSQFTYGTLRESFVDDFLQSSSYTYIQQISRLVRSEFESTFVNHTDTAMNIVRNGGYAFIYHDAILEQFKRERCLVLTNGFSQFFYSLALPLNSDYTKIINEQINILKSTGVMDQLLRDYNITDVSTQCLPSDWLGDIFQFLSREFTPDPVNSLKIQQTAGIFVFMLIGIIVSFIIAIFEVIFRCVTRKISNGD